MARATDMNQESLFMESPCILFLLACSVLRQKYTMRQTPICSCCQNVCSSSRWTHTWLLSAQSWLLNYSQFSKTLCRCAKTETVSTQLKASPEAVESSGGNHFLTALISIMHKVVCLNQQLQLCFLSPYWIWAKKSRSIQEWFRFLGNPWKF